MLKQHQQIFKKCWPVDVIPVEGYTPKMTGKANKRTICLLFQERRNHFFVAWLTDTIIDAAQKLLKQEVPLQNGFQDVCCGKTCAFDIELTEFTQILHKGKVTGWQSASVSSCVKRQITALLATKHSIITLKHMDIQMQSGTYNCGPFAIAFATALVQGEHPGKLLCNQDSMKQHLIKCLELGEITMFPVKQTRWNAGRVKSEDIIEVHCSCRMPKVPRVDMIECSSCNKWFHFPLCVSVPQKATARVCGIAILVCTYKVCTSF